MHFIEHIIEPTKLLLAWQSPRDRTRYIVGEFNRHGEEITLTYLVDTADFKRAKKKGFEFYPAFRELNKIHHNVLDAFMRRLPPKTRGDFPEYLEALRIKPDAQLSDFALLGYSGAKLPFDDFSVIHPFNSVDEKCELVLEVAGFKYNIQGLEDQDIKLGAPVCLLEEEHEPNTSERAIKLTVNNKLVGYVNRGLIPTFWDWIETKRIIGAWIEKINGSPGKPALYIYVAVMSVHEQPPTLRNTSCIA